MEVRAGRNNPKLEGATKVKIKDFAVHPKYERGSYYFDVGLAYLKEVQENNICIGFNNFFTRN